MIGISHSTTFGIFLQTLTEDDAALVEEGIIKLADNQDDFDVKDCKHYQDRKKVLLPEANVIVFYRTSGDRWLFYEGVKNNDLFRSAYQYPAHCGPY